MKTDHFSRIIIDKNARRKYFLQLDRLIELLRENNHFEAAIDYLKTKNRISAELALLDGI